MENSARAVKGIKDLSEVAKYSNGNEILKKAYKRAQEIVEENKEHNYRILNPQSQLEELGL